jgi:hypothetical protein
MMAGLIGSGSLFLTMSLTLGLWAPILDGPPRVLGEYLRLILLLGAVVGGLLGIVLGIRALRDRRGGAAGWAILGIVSGLLTELLLLGSIITSSTTTPA